MHRSTLPLLLAWLGLLALAAPALPQTLPAAPPSPLDPQAAVPPLRHRSAFVGYRSHTLPADAAASGAWRHANEQVRRAGGWRVYAREAAAAEPATAATGGAR
jgi:hypothetical protein